MSIVLAVTTNQRGSEFPSNEIYFKEEKWFERTLNCHSSSWEEMGTCQCVSHDTWHTNRISREEAKKALESHISELTEEERADLLSPSLQQKINEIFGLLGFTWDQVETWCADCYRMDLNPLPALRNHLKNLCQVDFAYDSRDQGWFFDAKQNTLVCWLSNPDDKEDWRVELKVYEIKKEIEKSKKQDEDYDIYSAAEIEQALSDCMKADIVFIPYSLWWEMKARKILDKLIINVSSWEFRNDNYIYLNDLGENNYTGIDSHCRSYSHIEFQDIFLHAKEKGEISLNLWNEAKRRNFFDNLMEGENLENWVDHGDVYMHRC